MSLAARVADLERRLANVTRPGTVVEADYAKARLRVKIGANTTAWLPWMTSRAGGDRSWHAPEIGEQVLVLSPSGDMAQGYIVPSVFQNDFGAPANAETMHRTEYEDGAIVEYDRENHRLKAIIPGEVIVEAEGAVKVTSEKSIEATAQEDIVADSQQNITATAQQDISATAQGDIVATATGSITANATASVTITAGAEIALSAPLISIVGEVVQTGGDMLSMGISAQLHSHSAVTTGTEVSGPPVP